MLKHQSLTWVSLLFDEAYKVVQQSDWYKETVSTYQESLIETFSSKASQSLNWLLWKDSQKIISVTGKQPLSQD